MYASPLQMIGTRSSLFLFYLGEVPTSGGAASSSASAPSGQGATSFVERVARFDGRTWRQFTVTNRAWPQQGTWLRTGDHFTMYSGIAMYSGQADSTTGKGVPVDLIFDPSTNTFGKQEERPTTIPPGLPSIPANVSDRPVTVSTGTSAAKVASTMLAVLDPTLDHWSTYEGPSRSVLDGFSTTWAGNQLFFWGGYHPGRKGPSAVISDQGWIWTPPTTEHGGELLLGFDIDGHDRCPVDRRRRSAWASREGRAGAAAGEMAR